MLAVASATGRSDAQLTVVATQPPQGSAFSAPPMSITFTMSNAVRADSLDMADLAVDGGATVTGVELVDGRTVRFTVDVPAVDGPYHYTLREGAFEDLQGGESKSFAGLFVMDLSGPRVLEQDPMVGEEVSPPVSALGLTFDEAIDATSVGVSDIVSFTGPNGEDLLDAITGV